MNEDRIFRTDSNLFLNDQGVDVGLLCFSCETRQHIRNSFIRAFTSASKQSPINFSFVSIIGLFNP